MILADMNKPDISKLDLSQRVVATLAYFDIFRKALRVSELSRLVLGEQANEGEISQALVKLGEKVSEHDGHYSLNDTDESLKSFSESEKESRLLLNKASKYGKIFQSTPFVEFVAVCNYLPLGIADGDSDIDLFIVTKKERIFLARVFVTVFLHFMRLRRHGSKVKGRFCLSFYVSEGRLNFGDLLLADDIYFAYWLVALHPIYGSQNVWQQIKSENKEWLPRYLAGDRYDNVDFPAGRKWWRAFLEVILGGRLGNWGERRWQSFFLRRHSKRTDLPSNASIVISNTRLKFHNNDRREYFGNEWKSRLKRLGFFE